MNMHRAKRSKSNAQRSTSKRWVAARSLALGAESSMLNVERFGIGGQPLLSATRRQVANLSYFLEVA